jgi:hypothetical protein
MYINFNKLIKRLKTEGVLEESFKFRILEEVIRNLDYVDFQLFYWKTLEFLKELKLETLKEHLPIEIEIKKKLENRLEVIDKK